MNFKEIVAEEFFFEAVGKNLILLDVDDTLMKAQNIFIYKKTHKGETSLNPAEFARDYAKTKDKSLYDLRDFRNIEKIAKSIKTGLPIIPNLKIMDDYINKGWEIGILTARGLEDIVFKSLKAWLMFRNKKGKLENIGPKLIRDLVFAINDDNKHYPGETSFEKKANVIKNLIKKYDRIIFIDDDEQNIKAVRKLKKNNNMKNLYIKKAEQY